MEEEGEGEVRRAFQPVSGPEDDLLIGIGQNELDESDSELADPDSNPANSIPALDLLRRRLDRGGGPRGAHLAELALRAGFTPPARHFESISLWTELARENALLRREADKLLDRAEVLGRRIRRAKARAKALRLRLVERHFGLSAGSLWKIPWPLATRPAANETGPKPAATGPADASAGKARIPRAGEPEQK